jgi:16S rRNA C1402 (ribose-2'-O) methylase RsmI
MITAIIQASIPTFFYESVHRIEKTILHFIELGATGTITITRELSKKHEQTITDTIDVIAEKIRQ